MARARNIKPGFFKNEILGVADPLYSILFEGLWVIADREGRLEDRPLRIKAEILPYRDGINVDAMLGWLEENGFIKRYAVGGTRYICVLNFAKHQNPHKNETESEIPPPDENNTCTEKIGTTSEIIGSARADSLFSDSLIPDSLNLIPDSLNHENPSPGVASDHPVAAPKKSAKAKPAEEPATKAVWAAYAAAYAHRYGAEPIRNAKVNGQLAQFLHRIPAEEAPAVAQHYVASNRGLYVSSGHCVDLMLRDSEKLRTEWVTQRQTTDTQARMMDQTASNPFAKLAMDRAKELANAE